MTIEQLLDLCLEATEVYENSLNRLNRLNITPAKSTKVEELKEVVERLKIEYILFNDKNNYDDYSGNDNRYDLGKYLYELPNAGDRQILLEAIREVTNLKRRKITQLTNTILDLELIKNTYSIFEKSEIEH